MPAIAAPPPPRLRPRSASQLELPAIAFFGRTLAEYTRFFGLDVPALRGRDVLDVGAGPSSFTAEATARRINAVAVDPLYDESTEALTSRAAQDYDVVESQIRANRRLFRTGPAVSSAGTPTAFAFESITGAEAERRSAAQRFLADYAIPGSRGRYVWGSLPRLPFFDGTFDLVLCAHLLFVYGDRFDFEWHLAACRELVRVSAEEVRIHPLVGLNGRTYPQLAALRRELKNSGIVSEVRAVRYEFFSGTDATLVLRRAAP